MSAKVVGSNEIDASEYKVEPGHAMMPADQMGFNEDSTLLLDNARLQQIVENDPRFSAEALERRANERKAAEKAASTSTNNSSSSSSNLAPAPTASTSNGQQLPDVMSFGFCKLVYDFLGALQTRFYRRTMIAKTYELFWQLAEKAPSMSYDKFSEVVFQIGETLVAKLLEKQVANAESVTKTESKLIKRAAKLSAKKQAGDKNAGDQLRQLYGEQTLALFDERIRRRASLPKNETEVLDADKAQLFNEFEIVVLEQVMKIPLFRLAKLNTLWCVQLDLQTRDTIWQYLQRLCKVTSLIDNFDPDMKKMINSVSLDSLNSMKNKKKGEVDVNLLLEELQARVMDDEAFLEKISEIAAKQL